MKKTFQRFFRCTDESTSAWERLMLLKCKKHEALLTVLITALIVFEVACVVSIFIMHL